MRSHTNSAFQRRSFVTDIKIVWCIGQTAQPVTVCLVYPYELLAHIVFNGR